MDKRVKIFIFAVLVIVSGFLAYETTNGNLENYAFELISYNYSAYASIPNNTHDSGSLGGFYNIQGKGHNFSFDIVMPGAEDYEDPLCYTKDGLKGTGTLDSINITFNTINSLINRDFKGAMFKTPFLGHFNMSCAAWTGYGNFSNNGTNLVGEFKINGPMTDWEGTFHMVPENGRIVVNSDYICYPRANKTLENIENIKKTYYM